MGAAIGMDTEELFNDEDLDYTCPLGGMGSHGSKPTAGSSSRNHSVRLTLALFRSRCSITIFYILKSFVWHWMVHKGWRKKSEGVVVYLWVLCGSNEVFVCLLSLTTCFSFQQTCVQTCSWGRCMTTRSCHAPGCPGASDTWPIGVEQ